MGQRSGFGAPGYVQLLYLLPYVISFENDYKSRYLLQTSCVCDMNKHIHTYMYIIYIYIINSCGINVIIKFTIWP